MWALKFRLAHPKTGRRSAASPNREIVISIDALESSETHDFGDGGYELGKHIVVTNGQLVDLVKDGG